MRNTLIYTFIFACFLLIVGSVHAVVQNGVAQQIGIMPPPSGQNTPGGIFGQNHSYTVTFRGNGEAVVSMKAIFTNYEEATKSALVYEIPKVRPQNIIAYQVIREKQCMQYQPQEYDEVSRTYKPTKPVCIEYQEPQYDYFYDTNTTYKKASVTTSGDRITIELPQAVSPEKSGSIILYYRTAGYAKKGMFGVYDFSFESIKSEDSIQSLTVGVTTDSGLKLQDADTEVNYDLKEGAMPAMGMVTMTKDSGITNYRFDDYYRRIGTGKLIKSASELQPFDSLTVTGRYAKSSFALYGTKVIAGVVIILAILIAAGYLIRRVLRHMSVFPESKEDSSHASHTRLMNILLMSGTSFFTSLLISIFLIISYVLLQYVQRYGSSDGTMILFILMLVGSSIMYPLVIFGPAILIGMKRGLWWGVATVGLTAALLFIYAAIGISILYVGITSHGYYPDAPVYMMGEKSIDTIRN